MADAYRADLLRQRFDQLKEEARKMEQQGQTEPAVNLYQEAISILETLQQTEAGGKAEAKMQDRLERHVQQLQGTEPADDDSSQSVNCDLSTASASDSDGGVEWEMFEAEQSDIDFSDVGGREKLKAEIRDMFLNPIQEKEEYEYYGLDTPNGLLLYGPPGTGKTYMGKAIGGELDATFVHVRSGDLKSKYKGESEANVTELFDKARSDQPCVLFFDEADALFTSRDEWGSDGDMVNSILREISELKGEDVFVVGATNNPKRLDKAVLRNGRMDKRVKVGLPSKKTRLAMLRKLAENHPMDTGRVDLRSIADDTHGYSAADLESLLQDAALQAKREDIDINQKHLRDAVQTSNPSVPRSVVQD